MYLSEQYKAYKIAYDLTKNQGYNLLYFNGTNLELWLEKRENNTSKVIRILQKGFDWKNYLKKDIAMVFQQTKAMKRFLSGRSIDIYNIYVSSYTPIDDWEFFKKPLQLNEKNTPKMKIYYITEDNSDEEIYRLENDLGTKVSTYNDDEKSDEEKEAAVNRYKHSLLNLQYKKKKAAIEVKNLFSFGKPIITYFLIVINILIFALLESNGGSTNVETLINFGAKYNPAMMDGEWWRIISSMFLHIGFLHLAMNMIAHYYLGVAVERIYGSGRFLIVYFLAGIAGSLTSFTFSANVSAGASGAIFGLFGALLFFGTIHKKIFFQTMGRNIITVVALNIILGFVIPQIDTGAHIGGLIAGFIASAIVHLPRNRKIAVQLPALLVYLLITSSLFIFGVNSNANSMMYQLIKIEEYTNEGNFEKVVTQTTNALEKPGVFEAELLFQRSIAYIELNQEDLAIKDLENSITIKNDIPEAYYNLALLYYLNGEQDKAEEMVKTAYRLKPEDEDYKKLFDQITGLKNDKL